MNVKTINPNRKNKQNRYASKVVDVEQVRRYFAKSPERDVGTALSLDIKKRALVPKEMDIDGLENDLSPMLAVHNRKQRARSSYMGARNAKPMLSHDFTITSGQQAQMRPSRN